MDFTYFSTHQSEVATQFGQHVELTVITLVIAMAIAVPVGTLISRFPILYTPLIALFGIIYTIPSLALLAFLVVYVGIGRTNAIIALVAYAQFILVRNVVVGLRGVDPIVIDAARGMGMSRMPNHAEDRISAGPAGHSGRRSYRRRSQPSPSPRLPR